MKSENTQSLLVPSHVQNPLEEYIKENMLTKNSSTSKKVLAFRTILGLLGAAWGLPWIKAAGGAAIIFPEEARAGMASFFGAGIVLAVGADGLWVMLEVGKDTTTAHRLSREGLIATAAKWTIATPLAVVSCIPSVYASFIFNQGSTRFLALITLVDNLGYGLYGYSKLIGKVIDWARNYGLPVSNERHTKALVLKGISALLSSNARSLIPSSINTPEQLLNYLIREATSTTSQNVHSIPRLVTQILAGLIVAAGGGVVDIFLTKGFLKTIYVDDPTYILPMLIALPGAVTTFISTADLAGRIYNRVAVGGSFNPLLHTTHPVLSYAVPLISGVLAATAPTAAAYITYVTLTAEKVDPGFTWFAVSSMIAARYLFSNFTLNRVFSDCIANVTRRLGSSNSEHIEQYQQLEDLRPRVEKSSIVFFKNYTNNLPQESEALLTREEQRNRTPARRMACTIL